MLVKEINSVSFYLSSENSIDSKLSLDNLIIFLGLLGCLDCAPGEFGFAVEVLFENESALSGLRHIAHELELVEGGGEHVSELINCVLGLLGA